jgi:hypothetical protein
VKSRRTSHCNRVKSKAAKALGLRLTLQAVAGEVIRVVRLASVCGIARSLAAHARQPAVPVVGLSAAGNLIHTKAKATAFRKAGAKPTKSEGRNVATE